MLTLRKFAYEEKSRGGGVWTLTEAGFGPVNLVVGQNASGKTRILNVIYGLAAVFQNRVRPLWNSGDYTVEWVGDNKSYEYQISFDNRKVSYELFRVDGRTVLKRTSDGTGFVFSEQIEGDLSFKVTADVVAAVTKRDEIQHPFLEPVHDWARSVRRYSFGSDMGKSSIYAHQLSPPSDDTSSESSFVSSDEPDAVAKMYVAGVTAFGEEFDEEILRDFARVGYDCKEINATDHVPFSLPVSFPSNTTPVLLNVQERDLVSPTWQHEMSMGMFRALSLIINMNYSILTNQAYCILIDDIGEGLDFERSTNLIQLIINKAKVGEFQLIMTTNDRFVMNEVDISHWHVINRVGSRLKMLDIENSKEKFDEFRYLGLNNFDFFTSKMYLEEK